MRFIKAEQVFDGQKFLPPESVLVVNDKNEFAETISSTDIEANRVESYQGIICPGFVNAHCHLELSHLKGKITEGRGLIEFVKALMRQRKNEIPEEVVEHAQEADKTMKASGIVAVGDICNKSDTFKVKADSSIYYHNFVELIGLNPSNAASILENGKQLLDTLKHHDLNGSLTPHAPYSVSSELIKELSAYAKQTNAPLSIHNQESMAEQFFLEGKQSDVDDLYKFLNLDVAWYSAPGKYGLAYLGGLMKESKNIFVHNTFSTAEDIEIASKGENYWCFCPNANLYIEKTLPNTRLFSNTKSRLCFGTDSLASNQNLDLVSEATSFMKNSKGYELEDVLRMLTSQGAEALNIQTTFGRLIKGKNCGLNLLHDTNQQLSFTKKIC